MSLWVSGWLAGIGLALIALQGLWFVGLIDLGAAALVGQQGFNRIRTT